MWWQACTHKVKRVWGWPYFLIDECDDGYSGRSWAQTQLEIRSLHQIVAAGRDLKLNGMVGNLSTNSACAELVNVYAFARFCREHPPRLKASFASSRGSSQLPAQLIVSVDLQARDVTGAVLTDQSRPTSGEEVGPHDPSRKTASRVL